ncbi:hypothetical protein KP509_02G018300 [Ceratopteris richardii]|uniref:Uncharacterized protein n=1 Tax=Ceratopteris richardii TaxID=49495 RepID=A0A8T2V795_CERRI|nr:hypothetical protein KP509_02G018300 [Ceratopteris richardii]
MGNCMHGIGGAASKAAVLEYPSGRHEFVAGDTVTAHQVMSRNPGFYVAKLSPPSSPSLMTATAGRTTRLSEAHSSPVSRRSSAVHHRTPTLLPADAPLRVGSRYRLVTFEDAFYQFAKATRVDYMFSPKLVSTTRKHLAAKSKRKRCMSNLPLCSYSSLLSKNKRKINKASKSKDMQQRLRRRVSSIFHHVKGNI